eukprot:TRINITY_DN2517_c0_g1_i2.p1 TRINITY_DN2517_c0_g1~~TRINITY_DN2517_c0_g1_i2.p1  ORF type:complete len:168 (+),score=11.71 TRINITY_DN2517_c0_g1_i2:156-659(+)
MCSDEATFASLSASLSLSVRSIPATASAFSFLACALSSLNKATILSVRTSSCASEGRFSCCVSSETWARSRSASASAVSALFSVLYSIASEKAFTSLATPCRLSSEPDRSLWAVASSLTVCCISESLVKRSSASSSCLCLPLALVASRSWFQAVSYTHLTLPTKRIV